MSAECPSGNAPTIPMGRRNWLFCWTELGARQVGIVQSLLVTCKLQGVKPCEYLVDVLQRVDQHPAKDVVDLTPRVWKNKFTSRLLSGTLPGAAALAGGATGETEAVP